MRLILVGTGPFGLPAFRAFYASPHEVVAAVSGPDRPTRGRRARPPNPHRQLAAQHGTPVLAPEDINAAESRDALAHYEPDLLVVCDYGQILARELLATARLGGINIHGSLLPKYRGAAPVNWAIYHGETETGVSVIHMTPKLDAGPVIAQRATAIDPDETAEELEARLAEIGADLAVEAVDRLEAGQAQPVPQDPAQASKAPRLKKSDGLIDWTRTALQIKNHIRAMQPWPKAYTFWHRPGRPPLRLIVGPVAVVAPAPRGAAPGTVLEAEGDRLIVAAGNDAVRLRTVQPAAKRALPVDQFLHGYPVRPGQRFGPEQQPG